MSDSLKDQLISLGLANSKPRPKKRKISAGAKKKRGAKGTANNSTKRGEIDLGQAYRLKANEEKQTAESKKAAKRAEDLRRRQVNKEIQSIVNEHALNDPKAELKRNFLYKGRIRSVLVTPKQMAALNTDELALVFLRGGYHIVSPDIAGRVRKLSPDHVPELDGAEVDEGDHPVPDDMVW